MNRGIEDFDASVLSSLIGEMWRSEALEIELEVRRRTLASVALPWVNRGIEDLTAYEEEEMDVEEKSKIDE